MHKVIIVGGGFGGIRAALNLANRKNFDVKLITERSYFEYHAALYRSATGRSPLEVAIPLKDFFEYANNVEVLEDRINGLDADRHIAAGESGSNYAYDSLILALGNVTEYFGIDGLKEYAYGVKSIHEALKLKRHLHEQLINEEIERDYVVIGGGATGVELAAELPSYLKRVRTKHRIKRSFKVELLEAKPRVLAIMPEDISKKVSERLHKLGVNTHFDTSVQAETLDGIRLPNGEIRTHTVIWTAGVTNNPFFKQFPHIFVPGRAGRVQVNEYLQAGEDIYVIGDSADTQFSGMAQTALHDANFVTSNLIRFLSGKGVQPYGPKKPIYAIPVGPHWSAVLWGNTRIYGRLGWVLRRLADLRLYLKFLPLRKALITWRYGFMDEEICPVCKQ